MDETTRFTASVDTIVSHLENTQWWPRDIMRRHQFQLLEALVAHAYQTVPWYRRRFDALGIEAVRAATDDVWPTVPLLTRSGIQEAGQALHSSAIPSSHGRVSSRWTSGSTATPVMVLTTEVTTRFWVANSIREQRWRECDFRHKLAVIRNLPDGHAEPPHGLTLANWGFAAAAGVETGPCVALNIKSTVTEQAAWLAHEQPAYLHSYPPLIYDLARHFIATDQRLPSLQRVFTHGGVVEPKVREACRQAWDVDILDAYSANEVGHIAIQCAARGGYHLQAEHLLVEVLDDGGRPCRAGQTGRVVVTDLYNYAMPLVRYEIGDYAEVGEPCHCGLKLPTLNRVLGRSRNMFVLPNGQRRWPALEVDPLASFKGQLPIRQFQAIQHDVRDIEIKLVVDRPLVTTEEDAIRRMMATWFAQGMAVRFSYVDQIPRDPTGKFEDFRCEIAESR